MNTVKLTSLRGIRLIIATVVIALAITLGSIVSAHSVAHAATNCGTNTLSLTSRGTTVFVTETVRGASGVNYMEENGYASSSAGGRTDWLGASNSSSVTASVNYGHGLIIVRGYVNYTVRGVSCGSHLVNGSISV